MNYAIDQMMRAAEDADGTIDTLREELATAEADRDAQRTRAEAAEAEVARLTACLARANGTIEAQERARYAAEDERDAAVADVARLRAIVEGRTTAPVRVALPVYENPGCHSDDDGDCVWSECPQLRDGEPKATGRHCPRDMRGDE